MSEMKALEKLRTYSLCYQGEKYTFYSSASEIADEIEAEIADNYMRLPVDADGVPIRVGDNVEWIDGNGVYKVCGIGTLVVLRTHESYCFTIDPKCLRIIKPRTLEDVLREMVGMTDQPLCEEDIKAFADEIRELLGGDAE